MLEELGSHLDLFNLEDLVSLIHKVVFLDLVFDMRHLLHEGWMEFVGHW